MSIEEERLDYLQKWRDALDSIEPDRYNHCLNQKNFLLSSLPTGSPIRNELESLYNQMLNNAELSKQNIAVLQKKSKKLSQKMELCEWAESLEWKIWYSLYDLFTNKLRAGGFLHSKTK